MQVTYFCSSVQSKLDARTAKYPDGCLWDSSSNYICYTGACNEENYRMLVYHKVEWLVDIEYPTYLLTFWRPQGRRALRASHVSLTIDLPMLKIPSGPEGTFSSILLPWISKTATVIEADVKSNK